MECKELFIFENGQPLTTPPPQVSFWAFRLTVPLLHRVRGKEVHLSINIARIANATL